MRATDFLRHFMRLQLSADRTMTAEVRFELQGVEVRVDMVHCEIGDPVTWTIALTNDPSTPGHVLTADEATRQFQPRAIEGDAI